MPESGTIVRNKNNDFSSEISYNKRIEKKEIEEIMDDVRAQIIAEVRTDLLRLPDVKVKAVFIPQMIIVIQDFNIQGAEKSKRTTLQGSEIHTTDD